MTSLIYHQEESQSAYQRVSLQASPIHQKCRVLIAQSPDHNIPAISVSLVHEERHLSGILIVTWQEKGVEAWNGECGLWYVIFIQTVIYLHKQQMSIMILTVIQYRNIERNIEIIQY